VRDSSWPHHTFERNNQFFSNEFNEQRSPWLAKKFAAIL
jgi:hypothetical protein